MLFDPFYDPKKSYEENFEKGPFGDFTNKSIFENKNEPKFDFFGVPVFSPFGIPAGPLVNAKFCESALRFGFDIVTYKTVRSEEYSPHPFPNILSVKIDGDLSIEKAKGKLVANSKYKEPLSITNSFGVPSKKPEFWIKDISDLVKKTKKGQVIVGAFQGTKKGEKVEEYIKDFIKTAEMLKKTGVKVMEVNLSCPNEGTNNLLCYDIKRSVQVVKAVKEEIGSIPLIIKIGYFDDKNALREFVKEIGSIIDGISAINTIASEIVDENGNQALIGEGRLRSGVCGSAIKWAGLEMVGELKNLRNEFDYNYKIIGVGGVMNPDDFFEYREKGADYVMSATGAMWNPYLAREIKKDFNK
ncbi:MAG: dihydroorotate oxidase [Candidatus Paceibacterota bacterium]